MGGEFLVGFPVSVCDKCKSVHLEGSVLPDLRSVEVSGLQACFVKLTSFVYVMLCYGLVVCYYHRCFWSYLSRIFDVNVTYTLHRIFQRIR